MLVRIATILAERAPKAATVLDGAGEAFAPGFVHHPGTTADREQAIVTSTAALGESRRAEVYARGLAMTEDEAVAYATEAVKRFLASEE